MGSKKIVNIKCSGAESLPVDSIEDMQGNLKKRGQKEIESIITSIKKYGFSFPFFIWKHKGTNKCLDGHGRICQTVREHRIFKSLEVEKTGFS